ncbi:phage/plasmid primase, P4 family [Streptomyces sp. NBC_01571]|uniref:phage/plasmid primase, P4 family n=1 Tax=Streptomyces sp. NBC_01571 TaxID=2975883 RepID=UPI0022507EF4|nr:phage/plasmid primase, P4 family [Streptomyces sp. NBC_01571]MCX4572312.1 phage/plasmid primase, P4 family [Streptomyces sp. NBC_01571]
MNEILARFQDVDDKPDGGYIARCPGHGDSRPSLRIWFGEDGRVRMTCRAGCETGDVIRAVRLPWSAMFNATGAARTVTSVKPETVGTAEVAALRVYLDAAANDLQRVDTEYSGIAADYAVRRFGMTQNLAASLGLGFDDGSLAGLRYTDEEGRPRNYRSPGFRRFPRLIVPLVGFDGVARGLQGRDVSGDCPARWMSLSNPDGLRWAPYGVLLAEAQTDTYIVTEGPGDGLTVVAAGYNAVIIRGASLVNSPDLLAELAAGLKGKRVILAGDNDKAGNGFTQRLADGLAAHDVPTQALAIPHEGDDLTDWRARDVANFPAALADAVNAPAAEPAPALPAGLPDVDVEDVAPTRDQVGRITDLYYDTLREYGASDVQAAYLLSTFAEGQIKYAPGLGFFTWSGRVWERSDSKVRNMVHFIGRALMAAAKRKTDDKAPDAKEDPGEGLRKAAKGFTTRRKIDDCLAELASIPSVHVSPTDFDSQPDILSFRNGTVDLRTGAMREHRKEDLLTYCLAVNYDPEAKCGRWESFLEEVFPDMPEMPSYFRRLVGYGATGHTSEQCFAVLWGQGANGKSVATDTLTSIFRDITETTPFSTFEEKSSGGIPNDIAALRGSRFVMASEGESGKPMSEAVLKRVTGKDEISARFLRQEFFTFKPTFLLMLATNFKPKFRGQDEGLWRRVKLIPFTRFFAPEERDHTLDRKLLAEAEGIAAWAVRGAMEWFRSGLQDPQHIIDATKDYRRTSDALAGFFPGVLEMAEDANELTAGQAYQAYTHWCEAEGLPARERWTRRTFLDAMAERKVQRRNTAKGVALVGVRIAADHADAPDGPGIFGE